MEKGNEIVFYVAADGNDNWSGKLDKPNSGKTDGPFATVTRARDAIRELKKEGLKKPINVMVRKGTYFLSEPIVFTSEDSGTEQCPITYKGYKDEKPVISGGKIITGWKQVEINGKKLWQVELSEVHDKKWYLHELFVNGKRRFLSRVPKKGFMCIAEVPDSKPDTQQWNEGQIKFRFTKGDIKAWDGVDNAEVIVLSRWAESHLPINSIDEQNCLVNFSKRSVFCPAKGEIYYIENVFETIEQGEWYIDYKTGMLYYYPFRDEDMNKTEVIAPCLMNLIRFEGKPEEKQFIKNIILKNLTFSHAEWWFPEGYKHPGYNSEVGGFSQGAVGVPGAIYCEGIKKCSIENCTINHTGTYGIEMAGRCKENSIIGNEIFDTGAGGIKIGEVEIRENKAEQTEKNIITDNHIFDGGQIFHSTVGILVGQSGKNIISHNHIHDFYYTGISVGWTWGYGKSLATGNIIEFNHIHDIGKGWLSDMGGIYTLGVSPGTVIKNNFIHDIFCWEHGYGGWGIYTDEGSSYIIIENNIVYRTKSGGFHQHYGKENIIRNNIFALSKDAQLLRSRQEEHSSFTFEHNIVYWKEWDLLSGNWDNMNFNMDYNLYFDVNSRTINFANMSFEEWQKKGKDVHSIIADPLFIAPEKNDFSLKPDSPAFSLGFKPIDQFQIGIRVASIKNQ